MDRFMERVISVISKPPGKSRGDLEIDILLPWLRKNSELLRGCEKDILMEIVRHCTYRRTVKNEIVIKQGDRGDSFFIMLTGKTTVLIDPAKTGEDVHVDEDGEKKKSVLHEEVAGRVVEKRESLGKSILVYGPGKSFGEVALISEDAIRNASIVADEPTDLLVIHRDLFNRCLKARQEAEYQARKDFVDQSHLFQGWSSKFKHLLQLSLRREKVSAGCPLITQGQAVTGIGFITSGQAKVVLEPAKYKEQFPRLCEEVDEATHPMQPFINRYKSGAKQETRERQRRFNQRMQLQQQRLKKCGKFVDLCLIQQNEIIGDTETVLQLDKYIYSIIATQACEIFYLDNKNVERLLKRNVQTYRKLTEQARIKLVNRSSLRAGKNISLLTNLLKKLNLRSQKPDGIDSEELRENKDKQDYLNKLVTLFVQRKLPFVTPCNKDAVYHLYRSHEQNKIMRAIERRTHQDALERIEERTIFDSKTSRRAQPRSMRELQQLSISDITTHEPQNKQGQVFITEVTPEEHVISRPTSAKSFHESSLDDAKAMLDSHKSDACLSRIRQSMSRPVSAPPMGQFEDIVSFDTETSDASLKALEDKIRRFHEKHAIAAETARKSKPRIDSLRRFEVNPEQVPMQGGTVYVRRKECRYRRDQYVSPEHHQHIRRFIVPKKANKKFRRAIENTSSRAESCSGRVSLTAI